MTHHRPARPPAFALFTPAIAAAVFAPIDAHLRAAELAHLEKHKARAPWLEIAHRELGVIEGKGGKNNPRVLEYLYSCWNTREKDKTVNINSDATAWCSGFVNWSLGEVGVRGTGSTWSLSWWKGRGWTEGKNLGADPMSPEVPIGSIVFMSRNLASERGHVAFLWDRRNGKPVYLGGNQGTGTVENKDSDRVSIASYDIPVYGCYWPTRACSGHSINQKPPRRR